VKEQRDPKRDLHSSTAVGWCGIGLIDASPAAASSLASAGRRDSRQHTQTGPLCLQILSRLERDGQEQEEEKWVRQIVVGCE
jgi:hypothetical protein